MAEYGRSPPVPLRGREVNPDVPRYALEPVPSREADPMSKFMPTLMQLVILVVGVLGFLLGR